MKDCNLKDYILCLSLVDQFVKEGKNLILASYLFVSYEESLGLKVNKPSVSGVLHMLNICMHACLHIENLASIYFIVLI